jgi:ribosomal protein S7
MVQESNQGFVNKQEDNMKTTDELEESIDDKEVEKDQVTNTSDSGTASDPAKERIEEGTTEITEEGVKEVAKTLVNALTQISAPVKKEPVNPLVQAIGKLAEVQKSNQDQINTVSVALEQLLNGLGIVEQMNVQKSQDLTVQKRAPVVSEDMEKFMSKIMEFTGVKKSEESSVASANRPVSGAPGGNGEIVRKNLADENVLLGMLQK